MIDSQQAALVTELASILKDYTKAVNDAATLESAHRRAGSDPAVVMWTSVTQRYESRIREKQIDAGHAEQAFRRKMIQLRKVLGDG